MDSAKQFVPVSPDGGGNTLESGWLPSPLPAIYSSPALRGYREWLGAAPGYQFFDLPNANYGSSNFDSVVDASGKIVGLSMFTGYSANERSGLSLATVDPDVPAGAEVRVIWGEPGGGSKKTTVQPHEQFAVRAIVSPAPYSVVVRGGYRSGWRPAF